MSKFVQLELNGWRQFDKIAIDIHPQLTVLTGANGAGKSTLLGIFSQHFGWQRNYLSTPQTDKSGTTTFFSGIFRRLREWKSPNNPNQGEIGRVKYDNGNYGLLHVPIQNQLEFGLQISNQLGMIGFHVSSHRSLYTYTRVDQIPTTALSPSQAFGNYDGEVRNEYSSGRWNRPPTFRLKEALISMAMFGEGNKYVTANQELRVAYEGFVEKLRELLPEAIGFLGIEIRMPDVVLKTRTGDFLLDASSGGLLSLIDTAWRIYMFSLQHKQFIVTMDEPENHLHPSMQRTLLASLIKAFPQVQFIVATHSPFMVSSVRDSNVYVLRHEASDGFVEYGSGAKLPQERGVVSILLDPVNKAGDASAILRDVLGLPTTLPDWVTDEVHKIALRYADTEFSTDMLKRLRQDLNAAGMDEFYPEMVAKVANIHD